MKKSTVNNYRSQLEAFSQKERKLFLSLSTPAKVQDFLNAIPQNFEKNGETCKSPLQVMHTKSAHCMEGAFLAVFILGLHGIQGKLLHLKAKRPDDDHIVVIFVEKGYVGALSKTNHGVLRYREPVYKNVRELVMSYFHEYFLNSTGEKTLASYSQPMDLGVLDPSWITSKKDLWRIDKRVDKVAHHGIVPKHLRGKLRKAELIERSMGTIVEWKK